MPYRGPPSLASASGDALVPARRGLYLLAIAWCGRAVVNGSRAWRARPLLEIGPIHGCPPPVHATPHVPSSLDLALSAAAVLLSIASAVGMTTFARLPAGTPGRRLARAAAVAAIAYPACTVLLWVGETWLLHERLASSVAASAISVLPVCVTGPFLLASWQLARASRAPNNTWLNVGTAASIAAIACLNVLAAWGMFRWGGFVLAASAGCSAVLAVGVCLPLRRALASGVVHVAHPLAGSIPELHRLARALRPFAAAIGAKLVLISVSTIVAFTGMTLGPGLFVADLVVTAPLLVAWWPMRANTGSVAGPLAVWLACAGGALGVWWVPSVFEHLLRLLGVVGACSWLVAADRIRAALEAGLTRARVRPYSSATRSFELSPRALLGALGLAASAPLFDRLGLGPFAFPTLFIAMLGFRNHLRRALEAESAVDIALDREAATLARELE